MSTGILQRLFVSFFNHSLKITVLGGNPIIKLLCNLLPGDQEEAAKFLNVAHSKRYKEKKPYHDKITTDHDEL